MTERLATQEEYEEILLAMTRVYAVAIGAEKDDLHFQLKLARLICRTAEQMLINGWPVPEFTKPFLQLGESLRGQE